MNDDVLIAVIGAMASVLTALIGKDILNRRKNKKSLEVVTPKLEHHPFRVRLHELITYLKTSYYLPNKGRMKLSRDHLIFKLETGSELLMDLATKTDMCHTSCTSDGLGCNKLYNRNMDALDTIVLKYNTFNMVHELTDEERITVDVYTRKFNEWHSGRIDQMRKVIQTTCSSDYYKGAGCKVRQAIILDNYITAYSDTIRDAEETMQKINGELTGKVYKGEIL
jgi:hypothetical protein